MEHWTDVIQVTLTLKSPNYRQINLFSIYILYFIHRKNDIEKCQRDKVALYPVPVVNVTCRLTCLRDIVQLKLIKCFRT